MNSNIEASTTLERRLLNAVEAWPFERSRFYRLLRSGRCPDALVRSYAVSTYHAARDFCGKLASLAAAAPDSTARAMLLDNLLEEEGIALVPGRGLVARPERGHVELALRFVRASGIDLIPEPPQRPDPVARLLEEDRWLEAAAFLLVGQERPFAGVCVLLHDTLQLYGYRPRDLAFFAVHRTADEEHGRIALETVVRLATGLGLEEVAVAAAAAGARQWADRHGGLANVTRAAA